MWVGRRLGEEGHAGGDDHTHDQALASAEAETFVHEGLGGAGREKGAIGRRVRTTIVHLLIKSAGIPSYDGNNYPVVPEVAAGKVSELLGLPVLPPAV